MDQFGRPRKSSPTVLLSGCAGPAARRNRRIVVGLAGAAGVAEVAALVTSPPLAAAVLPVAGLLYLFARRFARPERESRANGAPAPAVKALPPSLTDAETGLPNRRYLIDELAREMGRSARHSYAVTLAVVEVARLEEMEPAFGPAAASQAAQHVAATLKRVTRASDFLARLDDSRFAVCLTRCTRTQSDRFSERVALAVANRPLPGDGRQRAPIYVNATASAVELDRERFASPVDFLRAAGRDGRREAAHASRSPGVDVRDLRRQLVRGYRPQEDGRGTAWAKRPLARAG